MLVAEATVGGGAPAAKAADVPAAGGWPAVTGGLAAADCGRWAGCGGAVAEAGDAPDARATAAAVGGGGEGGGGGGEVR